MASLEDRLKERLGATGESFVDRAAAEEAAATVATPSEPLDVRLRKRQELREMGMQMPSPFEMEAGARERVLSSQVGGAEIGEPGMSDLGMRFDIGLSDTFEEKRAKFLNKYPEGDFVIADEPASTPLGIRTGRGGKTILFRRTPNEPYAELDASMIQDFEPFGDLADLSSELPSVLMEAILLRGAGTLARQMGRVFMGNVTGQAAKEAVEEARDFQFEAFPDQAGRILPQAGFAAGGAGLTSLATGPINAIRGASLIKVPEGAKLAQQAAAEEGLPALMPSQIAASPLVRKIGGQAGATVSTISEYIAGQQASAVQALTRLRDEDVAAMLSGDLAELHRSASEQIVNAASRATTDLTSGGTALQAGIAEYDNLAQAAVNKAYQNAREMGSPQFDINTLQTLAGEIKRGIPAMTREGEEATVSGPLAAELASVADDILQIDPSLPSVVVQRPDGTTYTVDAIEQLRALRSRLWDLKTPAPGDIARQPEKQAGRLYGALTSAMRNAQGADPAFREAWQKADRLAADRFDTMEKLLIMQAKRSETPAKLAARLAKPLEVDNLRLLRETVPEDKYKIFQSAAKGEMIRNPRTLTKKLETFDRPTRDALFEPETFKELQEFGKQFDDLERLGLDRVLEKQSQTTAIIDDLIERDDTAQIVQLIERAGPDPETSLRRSLRGGIIEKIWSDALTIREGVKVIDPKVLQEGMEKLRATGASKLLTPNDVRILSNLERYTEFVPPVADSGTSLQAATTAAQLRELALTGFATLLENMGAARLFTSPAAQRVLLGKGKEPLAFNNTRLLGAIATQALTKDEVGAPAEK